MPAVRIFALAVAAALLGLSTHAAAARAEGWSSPVTLPGAQGQAANRASLLRFDAAGHGVAEWVNGSAFISRTLDSGASWAAGVTPPFVPGSIAVALDGAGNRVYAYPASSNVRIVRTDPTGAPNATSFQNVQANVRSLSLAVNPAGDVLVAWTSDNTSDETGIAFWAHDKAAPDARQLQPVIAGASNATPFAVLDPDRHAVVAYQQAGDLVQTESANAGTTPFGPPVTIAGGEVGGMTGAQASDGRAAIAWYESKPLNAPNQYASTVRFDLFATTRGPGLPFAGAQHVDGSDDIAAGYSGANEVAVAASGRAVVGYVTRVNRGISLPCAGTLGESKTVAATAQIVPTGGGGFAPQVLAGGGQVNGGQPRVAAGTDGRLAAAWMAYNGCGNANDIAVRGAAFAAPGQGLEGVAVPPLFPGALGFRADGRLVALASASPTASGPLSSITYDPIVPPLDHGDPPVTPPGTSTPATTPPAARVAAGSVVLSAVKARRNGTLRVTVKVSAAGRIVLKAFARKSLLAAAPPKGTARIALAKATVIRARTVVLTLRPTGRGRSRLRRARHLAATLQLTFTPAFGRAPKPLTRKVRLRYSP